MHEFPVFTYEQVAALFEIMEKGDTLVVHCAVRVSVVHEGKGQLWYWGEAAWNKA